MHVSDRIFGLESWISSREIEYPEQPTAMKKITVATILIILYDTTNNGLNSTFFFFQKRTPELKQ